MFSLTIVFGPGPMVWTLMFKTEEKLKFVLEELAFRSTDGHAGHKEAFCVTDDFGQNCAIRDAQVHGFMSENLEQSKLAHIERELHLVRTKLKANEIADADPQIRQARRNQQGGMPMLQPIPAGIPGFGPNGRFPA
jgi:hypothetical protein